MAGKVGNPGGGLFVVTTVRDRNDPRSKPKSTSQTLKVPYQDADQPGDAMKVVLDQKVRDREVVSQERVIVRKVSAHDAARLVWRKNGDEVATETLHAGQTFTQEYEGKEVEVRLWDLVDQYPADGNPATLTGEELERVTEALANGEDLDAALATAVAAAAAEPVEPGPEAALEKPVRARATALADQWFESALKTANERWAANPGAEPFADTLTKVLNDEAEKAHKRTITRLKRDFAKVDVDFEKVSRAGFEPARLLARAARAEPDLAFSETFTPPASPELKLTPTQEALISQLARLGRVGGDEDLALLKASLACLNEDLLQNLVNDGYTITVARDNLAYDANLAGRKMGGGSFVADAADGMHSIKAGERAITVRSLMRDGKLVLETNVLVHEIGHAVDMVLYAKGDDPLNVEKPFADAFAAEHGNFSRSYFHTQPEFMAEAFAHFALEPDTFSRKFPQTYAAFSKLKLPTPLVDGAAVARLNRSMIAVAPVTADPDASKALADVERLNRPRAEQGLPTEPVIFELDGELAAARALAKQLGSELVSLRAPHLAPFGSDDGFVEVTPDMLSKPDELFNDLAGGKGAVLFVSDPSAAGPGSPFMKAYEAFAERQNGLVHLVLAGERDDRKAFAKYMPTTMRRQISIAPLTEAQIAELVQREVTNDGYSLSDEAKAALVARSKGGDYASAMALWSSIKQTQFDRKTPFAAEVEAQPNTVGYVLAKDVNDAKVAARPDAWGELQKLVGMGNVKSRLQQLINAQALRKRRAELGLPDVEQRRLNMIWPGNPGTGKTTVARLVGQIALEKGLIRKNAVAELSATELMEKGVAGALADIKKGKDGVVFIDEFHQLDPSNNSKGKPIIDLLVPMLTSPEWADTIFIFAGYPDKLREMKAADVGLASRLEEVAFEDFGHAELQLIAEREFAKTGMVLEPAVMDAFLQRVDRLQRTTPYPGNARDVVKTIEQVLVVQQDRLSQVDDVDALTAEAMTEVRLEDVVVAPKFTVAEVMQQIDEQIVGNDEIKSMLWGLVGVVERNKQKGWDPLKDVPTEFVLDGPAGSGKTTIARLIGRLFAAMEILPSDEVVETTGGKMVGEYLGSSSALTTQETCEAARGKTLFIDEIQSMVTAHEFSKQSVKELLTQMVNHKGKFVVVVADYDYNVDEFLGFDSGVPSRFRKRVSTEKMSAENAAKLFLKLSDARGFTLSAQLKKGVGARMEKLTALQEFASGRDIEALDTSLAEVQSRAFQKATKAGKAGSFDWSKIDAAMLDEAFDMMVKAVASRPNTRRTQDANAQAFAFATQTQTAKQADQASADPLELTSQEHSFVATLDAINAQFADLANTDPEEFARQEADANSDYNKAIAAATGTTPEVAKATAERVRVKVRKLIEVMEKKGVLKFEYHCPFCGQVQSHSCGYWPNSELVKPKGFTYSRAWLIEHSLKKPFMEIIYEKKQVEQVVEEDRPTGS
ncbi:MAG: AAA family ATPase [Archangiaceae bacterium]|nr:AAA family ATPase [Archangiaceae bacterium]